MARGDLINYTNYKAMIGSPSYRQKERISWQSRNGACSGTRTYYISAPHFRVTQEMRGSGWWGYQEASLYVYPYDSSSGKFSSTAVYGFYNSVKGSSAYDTWEWEHNGGYSGDIPDCHLWKIVTYAGENDGTVDGYAYSAGLEMVPQNIYTNYFQNRRIFASKGQIWSQSSYASDEAFLKAQGYSCLRGTPISISTGTYKYICASNIV